MRRLKKTRWGKAVWMSYKCNIGTQGCLSIGPKHGGWRIKKHVGKTQLVPSKQPPLADILLAGHHQVMLRAPQSSGQMVGHHQL